ncbi:TonB-dependent receptor [Rhizobium sp. CF080]|uniref:TonB-dependent receptor domain-containing protein n=1 Tax=Rhizobium sp. (strain CF080) TaxID=1144310 RepID=UPI0002F65AEB|nr:TonB-dependent receptor [Rhizobium sp. CF080]EUB99334.1 TonB-dependent receptor [Rhizobium sp. CF080]
MTGLDLQKYIDGLGGGIRLSLLAGTILGSGGAFHATAQTAPAEQSAVRPISVAAGPLTPALNRLAAQTGLQILFDADVTRGKTTNGVNGTLTPRAALTAVLAGTGVTARFAGSNQITLVESSLGAAAAGDADAATTLKPIVIYGSRDSTTLQDTSSSVTLATSDQIAQSQLQSFRDAFRRMANVMDADWVNGGFILRGLNSEGFASGSAPIGSLYIDGVLQSQDGTRRGARGLWDVEQVEVYRGPQSTLSGRAAMAGAIYVKTKDPTFEREVEVSGTVGSNNLVGTDVMVNVPLLEDQIAARVSASFERSSSDLHYPTYTGFDRYDDWTTDLYYNIRGKLLFEPAEMPELRAVLSYSFSHDSPNERDVGGPGIGWSWDDERGDINAPVFTEPRTSKVHNVGLEITYDITDALRLTSQTGFSHTYTDRSSINYGTPGETDVLHGDRNDNLLSQELRLNYERDEWTWVAGLRGGYEDYDNRWDRTIGGATTISRTKSKTYNLAAFGEVTYEFVPTWKATVGGRFDYTNISFRDLAYGDDFDETHFLPKIGISKDFGDNHTVGFVYSQGFRTGGVGYDFLLGQTYTYKPEKAENYEIFYKGRLLDERLTLNANLFYTDFKDQQVEIVDFATFNIVTGNAASSRSWGFEIEPTFQVTEQFSAFLSVGYVNTRFSKDSMHYLVELAGYPFPEAPKWSVGLGGRYDFESGFYVGADMKYTSDYMSRLSFSPPNDFVDARTIVNVQTGYKKDNWEINLFAENLLDEKYFTYMDDNTYATLGERRSFGLNVRAKF